MKAVVVFIDEARMKVSDMFHKLDTDHSGTLDLGEFRNALKVRPPGVAQSTYHPGALYEMVR